MQFATVLLVAIVLMMMVELSETRGRIGRSRRSRSKGSSSKSKITKYTPIKAPQFAPRWSSHRLTMVRVQSRSRKLSLPTRSTATLSAVPQSIGWDIQCTGVMSPSRRREQWGLPMREKGCWMTMEICVWIHQQRAKHWRKESTTTWLNWQLQWSTKMEKRKHYTESTKQCRWKTSRSKTLKL